MRTLVAAYGLMALLLAAGIGPASQAVRDASLGEIEGLEEPRALGEFAFLNAVRPHLPPLIVDWLVVKQSAGLDLPDDVDLKIDPDGRFILVWPEGCEQTYDEERGTDRGPGCAEPEDDPCGGDGQAHRQGDATSHEHDHTHGDGDDTRRERTGTDGDDGCGVRCADGHEPDDQGTCPEDVRCPAGQDKRIEADGSVTCTLRECPDTEDENNTTTGDASSGNASADATCHPSTPAGCPDHTITAYDGSCVPREKHKLWQRSYAGSRDGDDAVVSAVELKVPYQYLELEVRYRDQTRGMTYTFALSQEDTDNLCWRLGTGDCMDPAEGEATRTVPDDATVYDNWTATHPGTTTEGNHTLDLSYTEGRFPTSSPEIRFTLFGHPAEPSEA